MEIVEAGSADSRIQVISLERDGIEQMRALRSDWQTGLLTAVKIGRLSTVDADFLAVQHKLATPMFLTTAHAAGKDVYVWTINDVAGMARMIGRGVDGIITDDPALARAALRRWSELSEIEHAVVRLMLWFGITPPPPDASAVPEFSD